MAELTGGQVLARCLAEEGVRFVFGLPSPEIDPFLAAIEAVGIRLVPFRHESAGAHMAEGLYKTTGQVAAVIGNPGPGSANLLGGVITARHEGVPLIAITSQHRLGIVYPSPPSTFQGQDQLDIYKPAVKWGAPIFAWDRIAEVTRMAFREMWSGRPGPVQIEVPAPVLYATGDESAVRFLAPGAYRVALPQASDAQLSEVAALLAGAEQPLVFVGSGADRAGACGAALKIAEQLGCPIVSSMSGRASVPVDHPNRIYGIGSGGDQAKREADVVLVLGSRLGNLDLPFDKYWGDPARQKIVQVDIDPRHIGVTRPLAVGILADARTTAERLLPLLAKHKAKASVADFLQRCRTTAATWWSEQMSVAHGWSGPGMHPAQVMQAIGKAYGGDAIYVTDGGFTSLWAYWFLPATRPSSYLNILELGMLGTGVPSALGAKLGNPDRTVVCVTGDGAAGFHFMEMQSAVREGAKLITIVFAEGSWTMEEPNEQMLYGKTFGTTMGTVRWDIVAQGLGCEGHYAESVADVEKALAAAQRSERSTVICVKTDRLANMGVSPDAGLRFAEVYQGPM